MKNIYLLISSYRKNRKKYIESISKRNITVEHLGSLDEKINTLKEKNGLLINLFSKKKLCSSNEEGIENREEIKCLKEEIAKIESSCKEIFGFLPNVLSEESISIEEDSVLFVEEGKDCVKTGEEACFYDFTRDHTLKGAKRDCMYSGKLARIKLDLVNFLINNNIKKGFEYVSVPQIATREILEYSGHLPRFKNNLYEVEKDHYLIPTGEIGLFEFVVRNKLEQARLFTYSSCFRNEDSAPGKINKCLIRQNHFQKVETFIVCSEESREKEFLFLVENVKDILNSVGLKYRIINVCPREMSSIAYKQYDFELWLPKSNIWVEVASCSDCGSYQLERAGISKNIVTLNCSALPIERMLAGIIETSLSPQF